MKNKISLSSRGANNLPADLERREKRDESESRGRGLKLKTHPLSRRRWFPKAVWLTPRVTRHHQKEEKRVSWSLKSATKPLVSTTRLNSSLARFRLTSGNVAIVVLSSEGSKSSPSTSDIEELVGRLEVELLADELELVVLEFLESLGSGDVLYDSGGVDHSGSEEPRE